MEVYQRSFNLTIVSFQTFDSSRAPGLTSGLQGSVNVHRGALLLVPQWQYISSFVFYIGWFKIQNLEEDKSSFV